MMTRTHCFSPGKGLKKESNVKASTESHVDPLLYFISVENGIENCTGFN
jgi:hypothetical protein